MLFWYFSERETATTALMEGGGPRGPGRGPSGNGFFNNNCNNNLAAAAAHAAANNGGDRSRLFRKSNGSKPVREWYVWMKWMRTSAALIKNKTTCVMYKKCNNLEFRCVEKQCFDAIQLHRDISINAYITTNTEWRKSYEDVKCQWKDKMLRSQTNMFLRDWQKRII